LRRRDDAFFDDAFFEAFFDEAFFDDFFLGTLAPFFRASESPIAIACSRLVTFPPWPDFPRLRVPFFRRCIARSTDLPARLPYLRPLDFREELFFAAMCPPGLG
jgi:hypothetical protein